jgi:hypothetical protein
VLRYACNRLRAGCFLYARLAQQFRNLLHRPTVLSSLRHHRTHYHKLSFHPLPLPNFNYHYYHCFHVPLRRAHASNHYPVDILQLQSGQMAWPSQPLY